MTECPYHRRRTGLPELTERLSKLPVDERGYPIPWFVSWLDESLVSLRDLPPGAVFKYGGRLGHKYQLLEINGDRAVFVNLDNSTRGETVHVEHAVLKTKPEFRLMDRKKLYQAVADNLCWVCGQVLGVHKTFVVGPMCTVNRVSSEPPSHHECATWSVKGCPFLTKPEMVRRQHDDLVEKTGATAAGVMVERNPGVTALWTVKDNFKLSVCSTGLLFEMGEPTCVEWYARGCLATRAEVEASVQAGLPAFKTLVDGDDDQKLFDEYVARAKAYLPHD